MNHKERTFWEYLHGLMGSRWHAQRHEDRYSTGISDVSYGCKGVDGWIELKVLDHRPSLIRPYSLPCLSTDQRSWLTKRVRHGSGRAFVFVRVEREELFVLWRWAMLESQLGQRSWPGLLELARVWHKRPDILGLVHELTC